MTDDRRRRTNEDRQSMPRNSFPADQFPAHPLEDENLNAEELEQAYLRALEKIEAAELLTELESDEMPQQSAELFHELTPSAPGKSGPPDSFNDRPEPDSPSSIVPAQIIEAVLFVGGPPLTLKKLASLFDAHVDHVLIESHIEALNEEYRAQNRPYEVRLGQGGYRLLLRPEYESIRNRVYGIGPREVRLSQDCLEVLALVAYRQPLSHQQLLESGKKNVTNLVRQLIRRELVILDRNESGPKLVAYRTTPRFLSLFGLSRLDELPQLEELSLR